MLAFSEISAEETTDHEDQCGKGCDQKNDFAVGSEMPVNTCRGWFPGRERLGVLTAEKFVDTYLIQPAYCQQIVRCWNRNARFLFGDRLTGNV